MAPNIDAKDAIDRAQEFLEEYSDDQKFVNIFAGFLKI